MDFHWQCLLQPFHPRDRWTSHPWTHCCPWRRHICRAASQQRLHVQFVGWKTFHFNSYLFAVWYHPEFTSALTLYSKLIFWTECVQLPGAYIVWVSICALPYTVVQVHCYDLWTIIWMWNYNSVSLRHGWFLMHHNPDGQCLVYSIIAKFLTSPSLHCFEQPSSPSSIALVEQ